MDWRSIAAVVVAALLLLASTGTRSDAEFVDLGDGLVLRADGTVVGAWELANGDATPDAFHAPEAAQVMPQAAQGVWRVRFERGW
jgi:hypothetical protein